MPPNSVCNEQASELRNDEQLSVGAVEAAIAHGLVGRVNVNGNSAVRGGIAVAREGDEAVDEIGFRGGEGNRVPAQLVGRSRNFVEGRGAQQSAGNFAVGLVHDRGAYAVKPTAAVGGARSGERGSAQLLGIESVGRALRRILPRGQRAGKGFAGEFVAESAVVVELCRLGAGLGGRHVVLRSNLRDVILSAGRSGEAKDLPFACAEIKQILRPRKLRDLRMTLLRVFQQLRKIPLATTDCHGGPARLRWPRRAL